jgi:Fic family protein
LTTRLTATRYLEELTKTGFLTKCKVGRSNYFINDALFDVLIDEE